MLVPWDLWADVVVAWLCLFHAALEAFQAEMAVSCLSFGASWNAGFLGTGGECGQVGDREDEDEVEGDADVASELERATEV